MGRPRIYEEPRVTTAFRLSPALRDELRRAARDQGVSVNRLVERMLSEYLRGPRRRAYHRGRAAS
jgi:hypothetical protein